MTRRLSTLRGPWLALIAAFLVVGGVLTLVASAPDAVGWTADGGTEPEPGIHGAWQETAASLASGAICDDHDTSGQICLEWCEFGADGTVTPSGLLCCKPVSQIGSSIPTCIGG